MSAYIESPPQNSPMADVVQGPSLVHTTLHRPSPSLMMVPGLRSLPFWTSYGPSTGQTRIAYQDPTVGAVVDCLESHADQIRSEYLDKQQCIDLPSDYEAGTEHSSSNKDDKKLHTGTWNWYSYMMKGEILRDSPFSQHFPVTTSVLEHLRNQGHLFTGTPFGFAFLSDLHAKSSIAAHTGPMNFRLRIHLPLVVPTGDGTTCGIRVGPAKQPWIEKKALVLDDSYEHEVWNHAQEHRVLLLIDIWHPDVQLTEREQIVAMFRHAREQGWLNKS